MSLWPLIITTLCVAAGDVAAERAIVVDAAGVPFAPRELAEALRVRVAANGAPLRIRVVPIADGVRIETPGGARDVTLGAMRGGDAARLVARAADDLLLDDLAVGPEPLGVRERPAFGVLGMVAAWSSALPGFALGLSVPRARWLIDIELGAGQQDDTPLRLTAAVLRLDAGRRFGAFDLRAGLTAAPLFVRPGTGDQTVLFGGNVSARVRLPVARALRLVAALGLDGFATRTEYRVATVSKTTPFIAPWLTAGIEVGL